MLATSNSSAAIALLQLVEQLTQWRRSWCTPRGPRIPEALWTEGVRLAHVLPHSQVAKALGLKPQAFIRRCATVERPRWWCAPVMAAPFPSRLPINFPLAFTLRKLRPYSKGQQRACPA